MRRSLKYYRVLNMLEAFGLIGGNDLLDVKTNIQIARMRSHGAQDAQPYFDTIDKMEKELTARMKEKNENGKERTPDELRKMSDDFLKEKERVALETDTPEWDYPDLKPSQFEAQQDIVRAGGRTYKKGEALVPTQFFILMDDLISD